jgi:hypothetical protein
MRIGNEQNADKDELDHRKRLGIAPNFGSDARSQVELRAMFGW